MMQTRKIVFKETAVIVLGQAICLGLMLCVYALLHRFTVRVLYSGLLGMVLACLNFFVMAMMASLAADRAEAQDVAGGQKLMKASYPVRLLLLALVLIACMLSGWFDVLPLVLPLLFVRPIMLVAEFFRKKED